MKSTTVDRADIVHFAGFHHLSPALDARSMPAFSASAGDGLQRCGWESFFKAIGQRRLALEYDPDDATSPRFIARPAGAHEHGPGEGSDAVEHARRFWKALFPPGPRSGAPG